MSLEKRPDLIFWFFVLGGGGYVYVQAAEYFSLHLYVPAEEVFLTALIFLSA